MNKPRSDSVLAKLPLRQRMRLVAWLRENRSFREVARLVGEKFGVKISNTGVRHFYLRNRERFELFALKPSLGIGVTITAGARDGELVLAFDAPPIEFGDAGTPLATIPATVRSAGVRVVAIQDEVESRVRLVAYPITPDEETRPKASASPDARKGDDRP